MANNPKKSKAFIITFIAVIILLIVSYYLFKNGDKIFGTKNSTDISKNFSPLLGSQSPKDLNVVNGGTQNTNGTQGGTSTGGVNNNITTGGSDNAGGANGGTGISSTGGLSSTGGVSGGSFGTTGNLGAITPGLNPLPPPGAGGSLPPVPAPNPGTGGGTLPPGTTPGGGPMPPVPAPNPNACPDDPLVFTDAEKTDLENLLHEYYLIAPGLKTADDISIVGSDITTNQALIDQANTLTTQCVVQKANLSYTGPQVIKDNPYYDDPNNANTAYYLQLFNQLEDLFKFW